MQVGWTKHAKHDISITETMSSDDTVDSRYLDLAYLE